MNPEARALLAELLRRRQAAHREIELPRKLLEALHPEQRAVIADRSSRKALICGRRAGKSYVGGVWLLEGAWSDPGGMSLYVARSKGDARRIMQPVFDDIERRFKLGLKWFEQDGQLFMRCPNGHVIWFAGCKDRSEVGKFRGPKYRRALIDEAQEYVFLTELLADAVEPALLDKQGELMLSGTPGPVPAGLFYVATTGDGGERWPTWHWTIWQNPFIKNADAWVAAYCKQYNLTPEHPTYKREWLGLWVRDEGVLVAPYDAARNGFRVIDMPDGEYRWEVVVDLGAGELPTTAFVVMAQRVRFPETFIVFAEKKADMIPSSVAARAELLSRQFPRVLPDAERVWGHMRAGITVDEGGLGKGYADEMRKTYGLGVKAAEKQKKRAFLELFAGDLKSGAMKVDPYNCRDLVDEMNVVQWLPDRSDIDPRFEDHAIMGACYGARVLRPLYKPEENPPTPGSPEWQRAEFAKERAWAREQARKRSRQAGYR